MASKRMDLKRRCLFVLSGVSNALGRTLAVEMCRRFQCGSVAVLLSASEEDLQIVKKEIGYLENDVEVIGCVVTSGNGYALALATAFAQLDLKKRNFDLAFMLHNEGMAATKTLIEPQQAVPWQAYVQENLLRPVALSQAFLELLAMTKITEKLIVNVTSSLLVMPFMFNSLACSCKKARDMYFRSMASEESRHNVAVLNYAPGIMESHEPEYDLNNNMVDLLDLDVNEKLLELPRVKPLHATFKLINILEEMSFISGHDVDYYDTFVL